MIGSDTRNGGSSTVCATIVTITAVHAYYSFNNVTISTVLYNV